MGRETAAPKVRAAEFAVVAAAVAFMVIIAAGVAWAGAGEVLFELSRMSPSAILGLLALSLVNYAARGLCWHAFTRHLGLPVPAGRSGLYYLAGFALTPTPGNLGEALRLWFLEGCHGCRYERTAALLVGDQHSDLSTMLLLSLLGLPAFAGYTGVTLAAVVLVSGFTWLLLRPAPLLRLLAYRGFGRRPRLFARLRILLRQTTRVMDARIYGAAGAGFDHLAGALHRALLAA